MGITMCTMAFGKPENLSNGSCPTIQSDTYKVVRGEVREIARLNLQHDIYVGSFGYHIHPDVKIPPESARVGDVATGTAIFLKELSEKLPNTVELVGFDISDSQFPKSSSLPANVKLEIANAMQGFPTEFHGSFDVVTVRLLVAALAGDEWSVVVNNLIDLLKPGGWLQWQESDGMQGMTVLRDDPAATTHHLQASLNEIFSNRALREKFEYPSRNLERIFREAGLQDVRHDVVSTDRQPHLRSTLTQMSVEGLVSAMKGGMNGRQYSQEAINDQVEGWYEDIESGAYQRYDLHCFCGRKGD